MICAAVAAFVVDPLVAVADLLVAVVDQPVFVDQLGVSADLPDVVSADLPVVSAGPLDVVDLPVAFVDLLDAVGPLDAVAVVLLDAFVDLLDGAGLPVVADPLVGAAGLPAFVDRPVVDAVARPTVGAVGPPAVFADRLDGAVDRLDDAVGPLVCAARPAVVD